MAPSDTRPSGRVTRMSGSQRRRQLSEVALKLFAERGFNDTTMDDIAEVAGVTKALLYQYFGSKRAFYLGLVATVADSVLEAVTSAVEEAGAYRQQLERGLAAYFVKVAENADAFNLLIGSNVPNDPELSEAVARVENGIAGAIEQMIDPGLGEERCRLIGYSIVGMAVFASRHLLAARQQEAEAIGQDEALRVAWQVAELAWSGLGHLQRNDESDVFEGRQDPDQRRTAP